MQSFFFVVLIIFSSLELNANNESPDTALALLQSAAAESEQESDVSIVHSSDKVIIQ